MLCCGQEVVTRLRHEQKLHPRDFYMRNRMAFQDTEDVKIITGIRRCCKSSLLKLMVQHLRESGVDASQIVEMNFESMQFREMTVQNLYQYEGSVAGCKARLSVF